MGEPAVGDTTNAIERSASMRRLNRCTFLALLCGSLVLLGVVPSRPAAAPAERTTRLTILQINGGGIRGNAVLPAGPLRRLDVLAVLPFGNKAVKLDVTGEILRAALENGLSQVERTAGRFPQVSGLRYVFDPKRPAGSRLVTVSVGGQPLDPRANYTLATFDFILGGGDGDTMLKEGKVLVKAENGPMDSDLLIERLKAGPIAPGVDGRVTRIP
ncbi:MAG: 5'-nucleotidase C-terminal domain-containing protein [Candidatus Methylomirabilales bacterium]